MASSGPSVQPATTLEKPADLHVERMMPSAITATKLVILPETAGLEEGLDLAQTIVIEAEGTLAATLQEIEGTMIAEEKGLQEDAIEAPEEAGMEAMRGGMIGIVIEGEIAVTVSKEEIATDQREETEKDGKRKMVTAADPPAVDPALLPLLIGEEAQSKIKKIASGPAQRTQVSIVILGIHQIV